MLRFQCDGEVDYFGLDPVAYAPALGDQGMALYRARLDELRERFGPALQSIDTALPHWPKRLRLARVDQRLAVHDRDVEAIIRTHARDHPGGFAGRSG